MDRKSKLGYANNSPYRNSPFLDINTPEGLISMEATGRDLIGISDKGDIQHMKAYRKKPYKFDGTVVREIPKGNPFQQGGATRDFLLKFLLEDDDDDLPSKEENMAPSEEELPEVTRQPDSQEDQEQYNMTMGIAMENGYLRRTQRRGRADMIADTNIPTGTGNPYTEGAGDLTGNNAAKWTYQYLQSQHGLSDVAAMAVTNNLIQESGNFRKDVIAGQYKGDNGQATGIAQWHPDRLKGLLSWAKQAGKNPFTLQAQVDYVVQEAGQRGDLKRIMATGDVKQATYLFAKHYERPKIIDDRTRHMPRYLGK